MIFDDVIATSLALKGFNQKNTDKFLHRKSLFFRVHKSFKIWIALELFFGKVALMVKTQWLPGVLFYEQTIQNL